MNRAIALFAALFIAKSEADGSGDPVPHVPLRGEVEKRTHEGGFWI